MSNDFILQKKILDFLFRDEKIGENYFNFLTSLTSTGFELYIVEYLKSLGTNITHSGKKGEGDFGLDAIGEYLIQCKKYHFDKKINSLSVSVKQVREFLGACIDYKIRNNINGEIPMIFISTTAYSKEAKDFGIRNNIELWDYLDIYSIIEIFPMRYFKKTQEYQFKENSIKHYQQKSLFQLSLSDLKEEDYKFYYRLVREKIALDKFKNKGKTGYIFRNDTLELFSKERVHNLMGFHKVINQVSIDERKKLLKNKVEILRAINILTL